MAPAALGRFEALGLGPARIGAGQAGVGADIGKVPLQF